MTEIHKLRPRVRSSMLWAVTVVLAVGYLVLPGTNEGLFSDGGAGVSATGDSAGEPRRLEISQVAPRQGAPGGAIIVRFSGAPDESRVRVQSGKEDLPIIARRPGAVVARLPAEAPTGYLKIRVATDDDRSKVYHLRVSAPNWRRPIGNLLGGLALLVFGIGIFARGARESLGLPSAQRLAALAARPPVALALGGVVGGTVQSTTAAAGVLSGLVASNLLAVVPAAAAFLGAQAGAAALPLLVTVDPQAGLIAVAIGVLWIVFAADRRATALGRLVLGFGLIAFALQALRVGFEPFVAEPVLLPYLDRLRADTFLGVAACAAVGALLVGAFQGPAPVLGLVFALGQVSGHVDFRLSLAVLAGSGLGAGLAGLLTTQSAAQSRRLAQMNLILGVAGTLVAMVTLGFWSDVATRIAAGSMVVAAARGQALGVAFALSQAAAALVLLALVPVVGRVLERTLPAAESSPRPTTGVDAMETARVGLVRMLRAQHDSLEPLSQLAITGLRAAGGLAEHALSDGRAAVEGVIAGPVRLLPPTPEGVRFGRAAFACLQLERALEGVLLQAERLTERRVTAPGGAAVPPLPSADQQTIREIQALFAEGLQALAASLDHRAAIDLELARGREIEMNSCDARARNALLAPNLEPAVISTHLGVIELVDAYEIAGNQAYRLAEALASLDEHRSVVA